MSYHELIKIKLQCIKTSDWNELNSCYFIFYFFCRMDRGRVVERKNRNEHALQKALPTQDSVITSLFSPVVQLLGRQNSKENSTQTSALWQVEVTWGCLVKYYCTNRLA